MPRRIKFLKKILLNPNFLIYLLCKKYIYWFEGFSYNFKKNGELLLLKKIKSYPNSVVFDVGANIGDWTKIAISILPSAHIHSFELSNETFETLRNNLSGNTFSVTLNNLGLSNINKKIIYKDYGLNSGVNTILSNADFHDKNIEPTFKSGQLISGDSYCKLNNINYIDFLKIDVEGAENLVLDGFSYMLRNNLIRIIQFEYGYTHADAKFLIKDFYDLFNTMGYIMGPLKPSGVLFMDFNYLLNNFESGPNFVAVLKSDTELIEKLRGNYKNTN